jgi:glycine cleavage system regulatory protein
VSKSLVLTVIGKDRPGIVNRLSDVGQRFGANWAGSRMAGLAGQFAGIVHFQVPDEKLEPLAAALRALSADELVVVIADSDAVTSPSPHRMVRLELVGNDRPGIVRDLSGCLARRGVSIEELHTEFVSAPMSADPLFRVNALLAVPAELSDAQLKSELEGLATEMMVDFEFDPHGA